MQALQDLRPGVPETSSSELDKLDKLGDSELDIPVSDEVKAGV
jgi:hypothetical protein